MIEIGIVSIMVLAVGYWVTLWLMSRHDDVLHGDFVHAEEGAEAPLPSARFFPERPPFPPKPLIKRAMVQPAAAKPVPIKPAVVKPAPAEAPPARPSPSPAPATLSERSDTLQMLLASIKRDLKDASQL